MNRKEKIVFLESYGKAKNKFEYLNSKLHGTASINYDQVRSTSNKSLVDRLQERDEAYESMLLAWLELDKVIKEYPLLCYKYQFLEADYKKCELYNINMKRYKEVLNQQIDQLDI